MREIGNGKERGTKRSVVGVIEELGSLIIDGKFLDEHTMGELEDKIWNWLQETFGVCQGMMEELGLCLKVTLVRKERDGYG